MRFEIRQTGPTEASVTLPPELVVEVGQPLRITASAPDDKVLWHVDGGDLGLLPADWSGPLDLYAVPRHSGVFSVKAIHGMDYAVCTVTVTQPSSSFRSFFGTVGGWFGQKITRVRWAWLLTAALLAAGSLGIGASFQGGGCTPIELPPISCSGCEHRPDTRPDTRPQPPVGLQRVVLIYESKEDKTTAAQWADPALVGYLAGKKVETRFVDKDSDVSSGPEWLKQAMSAFAALSKPVPYLMVQDAKGAWAGTAWPGSAAAALEILKKRGD